MKLGGTRPSEKLIPGIRPESGDARQPGLYVTKLHRANQSGEIHAKRAQMRVSVFVLADAQHQKNRRPRKRTDYGLRENDLVDLARRIHIFSFERWVFPRSFC
jgi:hypothetical protein